MRNVYCLWVSGKQIYWSFGHICHKDRAVSADRQGQPLPCPGSVVHSPSWRPTIITDSQSSLIAYNKWLQLPASFCYSSTAVLSTLVAKVVGLSYAMMTFGNHNTNTLAKLICPQRRIALPSTSWWQDHSSDFASHSRSTHQGRSHHCLLWSSFGSA